MIAHPARRFHHPCHQCGPTPTPPPPLTFHVTAPILYGSFVSHHTYQIGNVREKRTTSRERYHRVRGVLVRGGARLRSLELTIVVHGSVGYNERERYHQEPNNNNGLPPQLGFYRRRARRWLSSVFRTFCVRWQYTVCRYYATDASADEVSWSGTTVFSTVLFRKATSY